MQTPKLSIVLPCFNEQENLPDLFRRIDNIHQNNKHIEVVLVNNGSTDDSLTLMRESAATRSYLTICNVITNRGYGHGIVAGIHLARGEYIAWTHADQQTDIGDAVDAYHRVITKKNAENIFLKGRRRRRNPIDVFFTFGMTIVSSVVMAGAYSDVNAQPKLFHKSFVSKLTNPPNDFSLDLYAMYVAKKHGYQFIYHDVYFHDRRHGEAKGGGTFKGKARLIVRTFVYIFRLKLRRIR